MADSSSKLKQFVGLLIFAILMATLLFYQIQEKLTPTSPQKNISNAVQTPINNSEKKIETPPKKEEKKEEKKSQEIKSTLKWSEFSPAFQNFESKRQEVLMIIEQKLPKTPPEKNLQSLKATSFESILIPDEEKTSWGKVIQHWQQLNDQQQRLTKPSKTE